MQSILGASEHNAGDRQRQGDADGGFVEWLSAPPTLFFENFKLKKVDGVLPLGAGGGHDRASERIGVTVALTGVDVVT